ncbi:tubulin-tyrosine ligase family-domain-containing protein [Podospora australis]|uniref:Tubulin-tyrosine ligase family-domain-containing protein n=1 Tax=Podospora australis TaxID=1536484 RepID=A0AAN6WLP4_9PEZI|nr:tubulin-tyrosine ligase family-domain-containing protein [Podospora australis]
MHVYIGSACPWLDEHIKGFIQARVPNAVFFDNFEDFPLESEENFQWCDGWELNRNFTVLNNAKKTGLINAYPSSDALARKDYLARVVDYWRAKRPDSILATHVPLTVRLSLDYAEYVDEALTAADDLTLLYGLEENEALEPKDRTWWILKPALVDCGAGIRIFSTVDELAGYLELAEYEYDDDEDESTEEEEEEKWEKNSVTLSLPGLDSLDGLITTASSLSLSDEKAKAKQGQLMRAKKPQYVFKANGRIPSAQMREFVAQQYVVAIPPVEGKKWHVRAYALSVGRLKVHVFRELLALLACENYQPPWENPSLRSSLTNTALQDEDEFTENESMRDFWSTAVPEDLIPSLGKNWKDNVWDQICEVTGDLFRAAAHTMADKFTTVDKCFELFAVDYLVDTKGQIWLLEVNETPAFYNHGKAGPLALRLMESVVAVTLEHMGKVSEEKDDAEVRKRLVKVLDETDKLPKSNIAEILPEDSSFC